MKKILNVGITVAQCLFILICITLVFITIFSNKNIDGSTDIFNYQMRIVTTDSMSKNKEIDYSKYKIKSISKYSLIFIELIPQNNQNNWYESIKVGDVLTFKYVYTQQVTITHRVKEIEKINDNYIITLEGDNKSLDSYSMKQIIDTSKKDSLNYIIGKVKGKSLILGLIMSLLKNKVSLVFIIIVPCLIIIFLEVLKIIKVLNIERKNINEQLLIEKDEEIKYLKNKMKQLEESK